MNTLNSSKKFRSRLQRWRGQMESERFGFGVLLCASHYKVWYNTIMREHNLPEGASWQAAIAVATIEELQKLDMIILDDKCRYQ